MRRLKCFEEFLEIELDNVYRFAYTYMRSREDAEDVVSESVIKALKAIDKIKKEESVKCWFYSIVAHTALSELRKRGRCISADTDEMAGFSTEDDYSQLNFESMINTFDEDTKAIIVMKCCDDMTFGEISNVLGINQNTVKTRYYAAVKALKGEVEV